MQSADAPARIGRPNLRDARGQPTRGRRALLDPQLDRDGRRKVEPMSSRTFHALGVRLVGVAFGLAWVSCNGGPDGNDGPSVFGGRDAGREGPRPITPGQEPITLTREQLLDPEACKDCHPRHYREWKSSMHAYAADDPVFLAMNQRGQEE